MNRGILYNPGVPLLGMQPSNYFSYLSGDIQNINGNVVNNSPSNSQGSPEKQNQ